MNFEQAPEQPDLRTPRLSQKHTNRLTIIGIILTIAGIGLFAYFVYSVGVGEIVNNISRFGIDGFAIILALYFLRICMRSAAWTMSVYEPYFLKMKDARAALETRHNAIIALSAHAHALFRPVVAGYEQVLAQLIRGKTKDLRTRMANIEVYRGTVLHRMDDIGNYLNWYEATQLGARSDAFEGFLRAAREAEKDTRKPSSTEAIAQYLDALQKEF